MTSPRPVEPVVGMTFEAGGATFAIFHVTPHAAHYHDPDGMPWSIARNSWLREQEAGLLHVVLWTVGPHSQPYTRLCHDDERGEFRHVFCMHTPCKCRAGCRDYVALWPTRDAALAAGKACGWSEPVARRVVRR